MTRLKSPLHNSVHLQIKHLGCALILRFCLYQVSGKPQALGGHVGNRNPFSPTVIHAEFIYRTLERIFVREKKGPGKCAGAPRVQESVLLSWTYFGCLRSLATLSGFVFHLLSLLETAETLRLDVRVVDEQVAAALIGSDESVSFLITEPLHRTSCHAPSLHQRSF